MLTTKRLYSWLADWLTLMLWVDCDFADHCLDYTNVTIQESTKRSSEKGHPEAIGDSNKKQ